MTDRLIHKYLEQSYRSDGDDSRTLKFQSQVNTSNECKSYDRYFEKYQKSFQKPIFVCDTIYRAQKKSKNNAETEFLEKRFFKPVSKIKRKIKNRDKQKTEKSQNIRRLVKNGNEKEIWGRRARIRIS